MTDEGGGDKRRRRINPEMIAAVAAAVDQAQDRQNEIWPRIAPQLEAAANRAQQMAAEIPDVQGSQITPYVPGPDAIAAKTLLDLIEVEQEQSTSMREVAGSLRDLSGIANAESNRNKWTLGLLVATTTLSLAALIVAIIGFWRRLPLGLLASRPQMPHPPPSLPGAPD
jgi:hypothetical protein